jgi:hypothetical protein
MVPQGDLADSASADEPVFLDDLFAHILITRRGICVSTAAWYPERLPTFSDALLLVCSIF